MVSGKFHVPNTRMKGFAMKCVDAMKWPLLIIFLCLGFGTPSVLAESQVTGNEKFGGTESPIHITADRLESNHKMRWVEFIGNVMATQDDVVMTADRMKIFYKSGGDTSMEADALEKIVSQGNVKIVFDNKTKTAVADKAVYKADQKVLVLSGGNPRVWSGNNIVRGKKITLFQAENRSLVEGEGQDQVEATLHVKNGGGLMK
ncbi:MAG: lipopolysaccharide transport periplasmic protein LptA [Deltaproteobacteria bacterium]|nr:MAG: lipopolysaccharide transport periplasmic protein LptA [Deltaproteobacteria bacterium]